MSCTAPLKRETKKKNMGITVALDKCHISEASAPHRLLQHDSCECVAPKQRLQLCADMQERHHLCLQSRWPPHDTTRGSHSRLQATCAGLERLPSPSG